MPETPTTSPKVIAALVCDFTSTAIGTRSRLLDPINGKPLLHHVLQKLSQVQGLSAIALLVPESQLPTAQELVTSLPLSPCPLVPLSVLPLTPRPASLDARIRAARQWNLTAWRGGAGQFTCFDEEYHPAAIAHAAKELAADHVLIIHSHSYFLDIPITSALIHHHLHKNHEMRLTYTPCAPGLSGMVLQAAIVHEMAEANVLPWQLLAYDPAAPTFDTLIREACMQVDPALSKIPNRFTLDTDRAWSTAWQCGGASYASAADLALAAARSIAPGVKDFTHIHSYPRELEIELTPHRLTAPPGSAPKLLREARGHLDPQHWTRWFAQQKFPDDLLLTFSGDAAGGDPLLYPQLLEVLRAAKKTNPLAICLQTDLAVENLSPLLTAIEENLLDVLSITMYGHTRETYAAVANADLHPTVAKNLTTLAPLISNRGGVPLVVPRLLKVRQTIPELEPFFDAWIKQAGWAVIDYPTDLAGQVPFAGVIDMAPPKRRPCRRLWDRLLLRSNGTALPCDQDLHSNLPLGNIESHTLQQLWTNTPFQDLRTQHANGQWTQITPCQNCKEWHRA